MSTQKIIIADPVGKELAEVLTQYPFDRLFILSDSEAARHCLPLITEALAPFAPVFITVEAGEERKTVETLTTIWHQLSSNGASRHSLLINLGGGVITDMGGFAAATFKRGIPFINVPTTLLSAVDAAVGGKTGVDLGGLKNEVGAFAPAETVVVGVEFYRTLSKENLISGYAEMVKHALLDSEQEVARHLAFNPVDEYSEEGLAELIRFSINFKQRVVEEDPYEKGIRKALNLGHTIGHAIETVLIRQEKAVLHGYAVAWGVVAELYIATKNHGFNKDTFLRINQYIKETWGTPPPLCNRYEDIYALMLHDKKNKAGRINCTLLSAPGSVLIDQPISKEDLFEALDFLFNI